MELTVGNDKKSFQISLGKGATVLDLKKEYASQSKKDIHRLSFKCADGKTRLDGDSKTLADFGVKNGDSLVFKDLGPQIGYRFVFLVEYFGPMLFVLLYALRPTFVFGAERHPWDWDKDKVALLGIACWLGHFLKREFETIFVHKFSRPTMPFFNLFKNCGYYWTFGAVIGYPLCDPGFTPPSDEFVYTGLAIFIISEIGNLVCHLMLSNMRPKEGSNKRDIPRGFLFDLVSCPNYTFEVASWIGFSIMTMIHFSWLFTLLGFIQMAEWANKKHKGYMKEYEEYKGLRRKRIVPFIY